MIWMIFSLGAFLASILVAVLFAFDDWFSEREWLENALIWVSLFLVIPFIFFGVLVYELLNKIRD
jgi:hypothetical protein